LRHVYCRLVITDTCANDIPDMLVCAVISGCAFLALPSLPFELRGSNSPIIVPPQSARLSLSATLFCCPGPMPNSLQVTGTTLCVSAASHNWDSSTSLAVCDSTRSTQRWVYGTGANAQRLVTGDNWCLDVAGVSTSNGASVVLWSCGGGDNQKWSQDAQGRWRPGHAPTMCLDAAGSNAIAGAAIVINTCSNAASQVFSCLPGSSSCSGEHCRLQHRSDL